MDAESLVNEAVTQKSAKQIPFPFTASYGLTGGVTREKMTLSLADKGKQGGG